MKCPDCGSQPGLLLISACLMRVGPVAAGAITNDYPPLDRGYERIEENLTQLGARIKRAH